MRSRWKREKLGGQNALGREDRPSSTDLRKGGNSCVRREERASPLRTASLEARQVGRLKAVRL
jgi:hypothetical protein